MSKESDIRITPEWLLDVVRDFCGGPIPLDVCTEQDNPTKALAFYVSDGLARGWPYTFWCNPPYSRGQVEKWAMHAITEARLGACGIMLTKDDCRTAWNRLLMENADCRCRINRGVGFLEPDGKGGYSQLNGPMWGSALWYFGPQRRRFDRVFSRIGEVTHLLGPQEVQEAAE